MPCKHSLILNQSATDNINDANATAVAADYVPPHEHLEASNFVGFLVVITVIIFRFCEVSFHSEPRRGGGQQAGRKMGENKGLAENTGEDWIKEEGRDVAQEEKVLNITQTNEIEYGRSERPPSKKQLVYSHSFT